MTDQGSPDHKEVGEAPQSEHTESPLAGGLFRAFSPLLSGGGIGPFPRASLKFAEGKQDF